jgi:phosphatidate phosphatase APP1
MPETPGVPDNLERSLRRRTGRRAARRASRLAAWLEVQIDQRRARRRLRRGRLRQPELQPYLGHGTPTTLWLKGRVLEQRGLLHSAASDTRWRNLRNMLRRLETDEIAGARVRARLTLPAGQPAAAPESVVEQEATSDDEGYFDLRLELPTPLAPPTGWQRVELELLHPLGRGHRQVRAPGEVLVAHDAAFGVISDLDDTVVRSGVTDLHKMLWIALTSNPHTRLPFDGVAELYQALRRGGQPGAGNPVFYVSSSPWNLHDMLVEFMDVHGLPRGPLFLRDWSPSTVKGGGTAHKHAAIRTLLDTYPRLNFVLIGDSGEHDPEIYAEVVRANPGRVRAVYIRDVTTQQRHQAVLGIAAELRDLDVPMLLTDDTAAVAGHARELGLIPPAG